MRDPHALSDDELARFARDGFLAVGRPVADRRAIEQARDALLAVFASPATAPPGAVRDLAGTRSRSGAAGAIPELDNPSSYVPGLRESPIVEGCARIARQVLGPSVWLWFDHAICKPPRTREWTAWHQDAAYDPKRSQPWDRYVTLWVALQDVGERDGCMRFVAGSHRRGLVTHEAQREDERGPLLRALLVGEADDAVSCPLPAGGVTLHRQTTLHATGPNDGEIDRVAWILRFRREQPPPGGARLRSTVGRAVRAVRRGADRR